MLNDGGKLGFITMNSFIRSVNGRAVRNYFSRGIHDISILDFRGYQIFQKKSTYTCLFFLTKNQASDTLHYAVNENGDLNVTPKYTNILYDQLDNKKGGVSMILMQYAKWSPQEFLLANIVSLATV